MIGKRIVIAIIGVVALVAVATVMWLTKEYLYHGIPCDEATPIAMPAPIIQLGAQSGGAANGIGLDDAGSVYVVGGTEGDAFARKYSADGTELWTRQFGSQEWEIAWDAAVDGEGNLYVAGETHGALPDQTNLVDTVSPIATPHPLELVAGGYAGPPYKIPDAFLRKYDGDGNELWTRQFGSQLQLEVGVHGVAVDASGNVYVVGWTYGLPGSAHVGGFEALVSKYDSDGIELWTRQFGAVGGDFAEDVAVDAAGNVYVVGWTDDPSRPDLVRGIDVFVRKYDADGNELWTHQFGTPADDEARAVVVDSAGNLYVVGDAFVRKYSADGTEPWTRQFGTAGHDGATGAVVDGAGNLYVAGQTDDALPGQTYFGHFDAFVLKYAPDGTGLWVHQFGTQRNDFAEDVAVDGEGNVYMVGWTGDALPGQTCLGGLSGAFLVKLLAVP